MPRPPPLGPSVTRGTSSAASNHSWQLLGAHATIRPGHWGSSSCTSPFRHQAGPSSMHNNCSKCTVSAAAAACAASKRPPAPSPPPAAREWQRQGQGLRQQLPVCCAEAPARQLLNEWGQRARQPCMRSVERPGGDAPQGFGSEDQVCQPVRPARQLVSQLQQPGGCRAGNVWCSRQGVTGSVAAAYFWTQGQCPCCGFCCKHSATACVPLLTWLCSHGACGVRVAHVWAHAAAVVQLSRHGRLPGMVWTAHLPRMCW